MSFKKLPNLPFEQNTAEMGVVGPNSVNTIYNFHRSKKSQNSIWGNINKRGKRTYSTYLAQKQLPSNTL